MQNFSSGHVLAPMLSAVEVEDGKKHLEEDLNTTIRQLIMEKAIGESDGGNIKESSSNISHYPRHRRTTSSSRASSSSGDTPNNPIAQNSLNQEQLQDPEISLDEYLFNQTTTFVTANNKKNNEGQDMCETIDSLTFQAAENSISPVTIQDLAIEAQETYKAGKKPLDQSPSNVESPTIIQDEAIEPRKMCEAIHRSLVLVSQNIMSPTTLQGSSDSVIDPPPSQASLEATTPSELASNAYTSYMGMFDIPVQDLPYLEAGVKRHPQVLHWLNIKQRRKVFTSSFFSLFANVTRILRTTRRGNLGEDDRNYIRECCSSLEVVDFDASWLSYVNGCIEECVNGDSLKRTLEETEAKASSLNAQLESIKKDLASVEAFLVLLHEKASKLDDFIES